MSIINDCYEYIIGLTQSQCDCYDIPIDASTSLSGLYIDDLTSLSWIKSIENCDKTLWEQMIRARELAISTFQADTNAKLMQGFKLKRNNYTGSIGRAIINGNNTQVVGSWYGVRLYCSNVKSGVLVIKGIGTLFTQTGTITLSIYNNLNELVQTLTLNTEANKHAKNTLSIELPLHTSYVENLEYYFIYQFDGNVSKNNDLKCNCGGFKPVFNIDKPYFYHNQQDRNFYWSQWVMAGGFNQPTLPEFNLQYLPVTSSNMMWGLVLDVELKCKVSEVLCMESLDFESNNLAGAMALAIQHKAGVILASWIVNSKNLSRYNITETEQMLADIEAWNKIYIDMVNYIATEADASVNDCLVCKDFVEMTKRGILA